MTDHLQRERISDLDAESSTAREYDVVVLGTGEGAKYLAWTLATEGAQVAAVERRYIGGSCPNIACLPSKNIIHSSKIASYFWRSEEFGISKDNVRIDMSKVRDRKREMVKNLVELNFDNFKDSGAELIMGSATFICPRTLAVTLSEGGTQVIRGR